MLSLEGLGGFAAGLPAGFPAELRAVTAGLLSELGGALTPLLDVGLSYLRLDRSGASLSTGERQRIELTSTVRASTTGMLYVLDEPSVGLHPSNVTALGTMISALVGNGNSVIVVEHERELIRAAEWVIELGPGAGAQGGHVIATGTQLESDPRSVIGPFLAGAPGVSRDRPRRPLIGGGQDRPRAGQPHPDRAGAAGRPLLVQHPERYHLVGPAESSRISRARCTAEERS